MTTTATSAYPLQGLPPEAMRDTLTRSIPREMDLGMPVSISYVRDAACTRGSVRYGINSASAMIVDARRMPS